MYPPPWYVSDSLEPREEWHKAKLKQMWWIPCELIGGSGRAATAGAFCTVSVVSDDEPPEGVASTFCRDVHV